MQSDYFMALIPLFSRRKRQTEQSDVDIYQYMVIPPKVRVQLFININECLSSIEDHKNSIFEIYELIVKELREEVGTNNLTGIYNHEISDELEHWFLNIATVD